MAEVRAVEAVFPEGLRRSRRQVRLADTIGQGAASIAGHPLRAGLAALAIAAAVATVTVAIVAVEGIERFARTSAARAFGSNTFVVAKVAAPSQESRTELARKLERNPDIRRADLRFLERYAADRVLYGATVTRRAEIAAGGHIYEGASIVAASASLAEIRDLALANGRFFDPLEEVRAAQVAVLGAVVADELFPALDPLGRTVRIAGKAFRVIGVQQRQGNLAGSSLDRNVWIPLPAYERLFGAPETLQILARAPLGEESDAAMVAAEDRARVTLRARHQLRPGEEDDFDVLPPEAARGFVQSLAARIGAAAAPISAMALLAAVVVVANTILVSITQRTREIGVRRALGASRTQILSEVLAESVMIALVGGSAGVLVVLAAVAVARRAGVELALEPATVVVSLVAASASGLLAGWWPARHATRIDVVEALRCE